MGCRRDLDDNWWEIQYAPERIERYNALGGFGPDGEREINSPEEVDQLWQTATEYQDKYRIQEIQPVVEADGARFARVRDLDGSCWEFHYRDRPMGRWYDEEFERGDVI